MDVKCKVCAQAGVSVYHLVWTCPTVVPLSFTRHNQMAKVLYQELIHLLDIRGLVFAMEPGHELGVKNFLQTLCLLQWLRVRSRVDRIKQ